MAKDGKRMYAIDVYPESAPENWIEILIQRGIRFAVSPLHDKDLKDDGTPVKPHYHVILAWGNTTTLNNVYRVCRIINQNEYAIELDSPIGYYAYLWHDPKTWPDKARYNKEDIRLYNNFSISEIEKLTPDEIDRILTDIETIIFDNHFGEYGDVLYWLRTHYDNSYVRVFRSHTIHFNALLRSLHFGANPGRQP